MKQSDEQVVEYLIVTSEPLSPEADRWLAERADVRAVAAAAPEFRTVLREADALVLRTYTIVDASMLEHAPKLRVVGRAGTGLDNIDITACRERGIEVVYTPHANTQAVVEYVLALICDAVRPRRQLTGAVSAHEWTVLRSETHAGRQLSDQTLGILGFGRIGKRVSEVASALGLCVLYHDVEEIEPEQRFGATPVSAAELFTRADLVTIHVDGREDNRGFVDATLIDRMKDDAVLLNTSRGFVVDNVSLARFLATSPRAAAHLDVHHPEPFDDTYPLLHVPNAHLYPHLASRTTTAMRNMSWVVRDVMAVLEGHAPMHPAPS